MSVREYGLKFTLLARYALDLVATMRVMVCRFEIGLEIYLMGKRSTSSLNKDMDISRMMAFAQQTEEHKQMLLASRERDQSVTPHNFARESTP